jgi:hypothetical protein
MRSDAVSQEFTRRARHGPVIVPATLLVWVQLSRQSPGRDARAIEARIAVDLVSVGG